MLLQTNDHNLNEYILYLSWLDVLFGMTELEKVMLGTADQPLGYLWTLQI